jgi:hypothetical protein
MGKEQACIVSIAVEIAKLWNPKAHVVQRQQWKVDLPTFTARALEH